MSELIRLEQKLHKGFKTICLEPIENPALSWKAKGLHTYLISRPPGWKLWYKDLEQRATEGKSAIGSAVKELQEAGYLRIERRTDEAGKVVGSRWIVAQSPDLMSVEGEPYTDNQDTVEPYTDFPDTDNPDTDFPDTDNPLHSSYEGLRSITSTSEQKPPSAQPRMKREDMTRLTETYAQLQGATPRGNAWLPIQQGFRQMVAVEGYSLEQVIGCMTRLRDLGWTWTINTVRDWVARYVGGIMPEQNGIRQSPLDASKSDPDWRTRHGLPDAATKGVWESVTEMLRQELPASAFEAWIDQVAPVAMHNGTFVLACADQFTKGQIERRFKERIEKILTEKRGHDTSLEVEG